MRSIALLAAVLASVLVTSPVSAGAINPDTRFWASDPNPGALQLARNADPAF